MSTPPEHAPTEPVPPVATSTPPATTRSSRSGGGYDPIARIAQIVIAVVLVILLLLILGGYKFHVTMDKDKGGRNHTPKVTHSPKSPKP